jgi:hypothetical protein
MQTGRGTQYLVYMWCPLAGGEASDSLIQKEYFARILEKESEDFEQQRQEEEQQLQLQNKVMLRSATLYLPQ